MRPSRSAASPRSMIGWLATLLLACSALPAQALAIPPGPGALTNHVIVISIDGLRPDAIAKFDARTIQRLMGQGSHTLQAKTILPSLTLPSHTSMVTGQDVDGHGIDWNTNQTDAHGTVAVPTIFARAHQVGLTTAAFFSKGKFEHLAVATTLDHVEAPSGNSKWEADRTVDNVTEYLERAKPNLMFVHLGDPDYAGHRYSWMSWFYGQAVKKADRAVGELLAAADEAFGEGQYTVILTADHGGHGWGHGSSDRRDVTIPWMAWGKGVAAGVRLTGDVHTMDTASTALWLLGLPPIGVGLPIQTAFIRPLQRYTDATLAAGAE
jgi:arylsulfatase A-like enzyme